MNVSRKGWLCLLECAKRTGNSFEWAKQSTENCRAHTERSRKPDLSLNVLWPCCSTEELFSRKLP